MKTLILLLLTLLVSCGKPAKRNNLPVPDPTWAENYVSSINKNYSDIFIVNDTQGRAEIIVAKFPYTIRNVYQTGRILSSNRKQSLSINNHTVLDCFGPDRFGYTGCRIEIRGLAPGHYTFEY